MAEIKFEEFQDKYKFERELSRGSFGKVSRIREIKTGNIYALKKLVVKNHAQANDALNEIYLMNRLQHPSIVTVALFLPRSTNTTIFKSRRATDSLTAKSASSSSTHTLPSTR